MEETKKMQSDSIKELAGALAKAQGVMTGAIKDSENPFFKSKYADLASVWEACRKPLSENGLAVIQTTDIKEGETVVITTLAHSSGEWIMGWLSIKPVKNDPQGTGSAITYGRRYALSAVVGISPEDDDGEGAMGNGESHSKTKLIPEPQIKCDECGKKMVKRKGKDGIFLGCSGYPVCKNTRQTSATYHQPKDETTTNFNFLKEVAVLKKLWNDSDGYYALLEKFGVSHVNQLLEKDNQTKLWKELKAETTKAFMTIVENIPICRDEALAGRKIEELKLKELQEVYDTATRLADMIDNPSKSEGREKEKEIPF